MRFMMTEELRRERSIGRRSVHDCACIGSMKCDRLVSPYAAAAPPRFGVKACCCCCRAVYPPPTGYY